MLGAVIFDFDGVLVDSEQIHHKAFNRVLAKFHYQLSSHEYYDRFLGLSDEELLRIVDKERHLSLSNQQFGQLLSEKANLFKEMAATEAGIIEGVPKFLNMLSDGKIPMAIFSGALQPEIETILEGAGLRSYFEVIVSAEQVEKGKPDPEGFLLALKLLNKKLHKSIKPEDCVVIEDSHWGLEAAKAAGMRAVAITNTYAAEHLKPADKVIAHLNDLALSDLHDICA
ncbi:MAG: HAD family phosphatase [Sedimentisphaerales bacterium]|jgi:beta-phosphoglucomutase family hydrolase